MDIVTFEKVLIKYLFHDKSAREKIAPFLTARVFTDFSNKEIIKNVQSFTEKYSKFPSPSDMKLVISKKEVHDQFVDILNMDLSEYSPKSLMSEVEDFFVKKLIWDVVSHTAENLKDDKMEQIKSAPDQIREALAFSFNTEIGLDFFNDEERQYNHLHNIDNVIKSGLPQFDKIVEGGFHEKSLTLFMAETNLGKTLIKCGLAANIILQNKNVLYVTLEMSEDKISERILANLFDVNIGDLRLLTREKFANKFAILKSKMENRLLIKEYPTKGVNTNTIRRLLKELEIKKRFKPDIIFVDYLGIMLPIQMRKEENSYTEIKRISEELRGLAVETGCPIVSGIQTNRGGFSASSIDLTDIADSIGTTMTADVIIGVTQSDEFRAAGKYSFIILKNRYGLNKQKTVVDVNYGKMRITQMASNKKPESTTIVDDASIEIIRKISQEKNGNKSRIIDFK